MAGTDMPYSTKEVVANLAIGDSTLRKWCLALEEQNYNFIRTDQNKRLFTDKDLLVLTQFRLLVQDKNMSIHNAAAVVAAKYVKPFSNETDEEQLLPALAFSNETVQELRTEVTQLLRTEIEQLTETYRSGTTQLSEIFRTEIDQLKEENRTEVDQLKEMNKQLLLRLEEQHKYIEGRLNDSDKLLIERNTQIKEGDHNRDQMLMQSIRETQDLKKLLLEIKEDQQQKKPRKGLLKWFSKD